jgi:hypothetical protein
MKKIIIFFSSIIFFSMILMFPVDSRATSIKTKTFNRHLQRSQTFIGNQYKVLMDFLNCLTDEDVNSMNKRSLEIDIYNSKALSTWKMLKEMDTHYLRQLEGNISYIPRNFLRENIWYVSHYYSLISAYKIPEEDYDEVFNKYSMHIIDLLDKVQELRNQVEDMGLTIHSFPSSINGIHVSGCGCYIPFLIGKNPSYDIADSFHGVLTSWKHSIRKIPDLLSNKSAMKAQKWWFDFILNNDFAINKWGESYEEQYEVEMEKIEIRLAELSGASVAKQKPAKKGVSATSAEPSSPTKKSKFKLDLPK